MGQHPRRPVLPARTGSTSSGPPSARATRTCTCTSIERRVRAADHARRLGAAPPRAACSGCARPSRRSTSANDWIYFTSAARSRPIERHLYRVHLDGTGLERVSRGGPGTHRDLVQPRRASFYFDRYSNSRDAAAAWTLYQRRRHPRAATLCPARLDLLAGLEISAARSSSRSPREDGFPMPAHDPEAGGLRPAQAAVPPDPLRVRRPLGADGGRRLGAATATWAQVLLDAGFLVASVDNRSATSISKHLENDDRAAVERRQRAERPGRRGALVQAARIVGRPRSASGIWGWSGGGSMTLLCMTRSKEFTRRASRSRRSRTGATTTRSGPSSR